MKTTIDNETEFRAAVDQYGDLLAAIATRQEEAKTLKTLIENHANATQTWELTTDAYRFKMKRGSPSLRRRDGLTEADIVASLKEARLQEYVTVGYDAAFLKKDFAGTAAGRKRLADLGFLLTETNRHATVVAR